MEKIEEHRYFYFVPYTNIIEMYIIYKKNHEDLATLEWEAEQKLRLSPGEKLFEITEENHPREEFPEVWTRTVPTDVERIIDKMLCMEIDNEYN
ncbi:hypothetical protein TKK_0009634 [Trichogramma kaykai]